jgi:regulatory protein
VVPPLKAEALAPTKPASLKVRALQWLAQREHSPVELRSKLMRLAQGGAFPHPSTAGATAPGLDAPAVQSGADPCPDHGHDVPATESAAAEVDTVMAWLTAHGYLSQQRFVESRVNARQARFGNLRITRELQQHGVALDPEAQQALRASEYERARDVWQRRYGAGGPPQDAAARVRQMRFLTGRGFSPEVIRRVLRAPGGED